jgi:anti-sigma factor RsiW
MNDPEELIAEYLDDALAEAEREALNAWLKADRANLRRFTEAALFEQQIRGAARAHAERRAADFDREPEVGAGPGPRGRKFSWPRLAWASAAAAVLVISAVSLLLRYPGERKPEVAITENVRDDGWTVPTDVLLTETPTVNRLSDEISALLEH